MLKKMDVVNVIVTRGGIRRTPNTVGIKGKN